MGGIPTISVLLSQNVPQNYGSFLRGLWLHGFQHVLQEGMWEFESFQICHPSCTDKLFGQLKQHHTHTLCLWHDFSLLYPRQLSVVFYCSACQQKGEMLRGEPFVSVCAFMDESALFSLGAAGYFHISNSPEFMSVLLFNFSCAYYNVNCNICPNWFLIIHRCWSLSVCL